VKHIDYELLPAIGPGTERKTGTIADLVRSIPYLMPMGLIPPLAVLNDVLKTGVADAGMSGGCKWKPFQVTQAEHDELVHHLTANGNVYFQSVEAPARVKTRSDWSTWTMKHLRGVPEAEHRRLNEEYAAARAKYEAARDAGDSDLMEELFVLATRAGTRLSEFVMAHIKR